MPQQLSLLCGANPTSCQRGPAVRLQAGRWRFECDGIKDSSLVLTLISIRDEPERISVQHDAEFDLKHPQIVQVEFRGRGTEKYVSIVARRVA